MTGLGCLPDPDETAGASSEPLKLGAARTPDSVSHRAAVAEVYNQAGTNSCVGQAVCQAIDVWRCIRGLAPLHLSTLMAYWVARHQSNRGDKFDGGTYIRAAIQALVKHGVCSSREWPFNAFKVNDQPPWRCLRDASPLHGVRGYYRIYGADYHTINEIRGALARGLPVVFGCEVDAAFTAHVGPTIIERPSALRSVGGHAMCIVGYRTVAGRTQFLIVNSWGTGWRDGGFAWLDEDWILAGFDRWVVDLEEPQKEAA